MVNVYKVSCKATGDVVYQLELEDGDTEKDIVEFVKKQFHTEYSGFNLLDFEEPRIEHFDDNIYYALIKVTIADNFYVSVTDDEDLLMNSVEKFKENYPNLTKITEFTYTMNEERGSVAELEECFKLIQNHMNNK